MQSFSLALILLASLRACQVRGTVGPPVLHCSSEPGPAHFRFSIPPSARDKIVLVEGPTQYFLLQWVRGLRPLKMHDTFDRIDDLTSDSESVSFSLKGVSSQDGGNYTCREGVRQGPIISDCGQTLIYISELPRPAASQGQLAVLGGTAYLICFDNIPNQWARLGLHLSYTWTKDGVPLEGQHGSRIRFSSLRASDQGLYSCQVRESSRNCGVSPASLNHSFNLAVPPRVSIRSPTNSTDIHITEGQPLTLTCEVKDAFPRVPNNGFSWTFCPSGFGAADQQQKHQQPLAETGGTLSLRSVDRHSCGQYTCQARNDQNLGGNIPPGSASVHVSVSFPPQVSIHSPTNSTDIHIDEGQPLTLTCEVKDAFPRVPNNGFSWTFCPSGFGAADQQQQHQQQLAETGDTLSLGSVDRHSCGQYTCQARNDQNLGVKIPPGSASVHVSVSYLDNMTLTPDEVEVEEGDNITLTCTVECSPTAHLQWWVDGKPRRNVTANVDRYVVAMATPADSGNYTCRASNGESLSLESSTSVSVLSSPVVNITLEPHQTLERVEGQNLTLTCRVESASPPVPSHGFSWTFQPSLLPSPPAPAFTTTTTTTTTPAAPQQLQETGDTLTLGPLTREDSGQYTCLARNDQELRTRLSPGQDSVQVTVKSPEQVGGEAAAHGQDYVLVTGLAVLLLLMIGIAVVGIFLNLRERQQERTELGKGNSPSAEEYKSQRETFIPQVTVV